MVMVNYLGWMGSSAGDVNVPFVGGYDGARPWSECYDNIVVKVVVVAVYVYLGMIDWLIQSVIVSKKKDEMTLKWAVLLFFGMVVLQSFERIRL